MNFGADWHIDPEELLQITGNVWVFWKNAEGIYLGCNDLMAKSLDLSSRFGIVGSNDYDLPLLQSEANFYRNADRQVLSNSKTLQFTEYASLKNCKIMFQTIKNPLFNQNNKAIGILGISYYIKEQHSHSLLQLTKREEQILYFLRQGMSAKDIAKKLYRSTRTVEHHIDNIKNKTGFRSKYELIVKAI